ncbi:alpha/beta-hydrolase [Atractiella rhizophila]|nr:alpha/beta-hydrolase [Atractiella rhizophila]
MPFPDLQPPLNTFTVGLGGLTELTKTTAKHFLMPSHSQDLPANKEFAYDAAFHVMRDFNERLARHTVEDVQRFSEAYVPSPPWILVLKTIISAESCKDADNYIVQAIGEEDMNKVFGGTQWWRRRLINGVEAEWISMKRDWKGPDLPQDSSASLDDNEPMSPTGGEGFEFFSRVLGSRRQHPPQPAPANPPDSVPLQGSKSAPPTTPSSPPTTSSKLSRRPSIGQKLSSFMRRTSNASQHPNLPQSTITTPNTSSQDEKKLPSGIEAAREQQLPKAERTEHDEGEYEEHLDSMPVILYIQYTIWRHARKMGGRAFAVRYRLAPQFPFPCALADVLAAYLYLIRPPKDAKHRAIDPNKIVIAGDSAGGNLALNLLCVLRDLDLPLPAGGVLISPWCDLTHSFPSVIANADTDFLPHYGFVHKPSALWPVPSLPHPHPESKRFRPIVSESIRPKKGDKQRPDEATGEEKADDDGLLKVMIDGKTIELSEQIQMYATTEQLCYRYVNPLMQPSLGGLPPLLITCGDKERLRDEIIYLSHRASNPSKYPIRQSLLDAQAEYTQKAVQYRPTDIHLQIYDGVCHDFILFSFTTPAKYLFRSVASFTKWVQAVPDTPVQTEEPNNGGVALSRRLSVLRLDKKVEGPRNKVRGLDKTIYTSLQPFHRPVFTNHMIRERINTFGVVRPLEAEEDIAVLQRPVEEVGAIQEGAIKMYLDGFRHRDSKYKSTLRRLESEVAKKEKKATAATESLFRRRKQPPPDDNLTGITKIPGQHPPPGSLAGRRNTADARELIKSFEAHKNMPIHPLNLWSEIHDIGALGDRPPRQEKS